MRVGQLSPCVECPTCHRSLVRQGERSVTPGRCDCSPGAMVGTSGCEDSIHRSASRNGEFSSAVICSLRSSWGPSIPSLPFPADSQHRGRCKWGTSWWAGCFPAGLWVHLFQGRSNLVLCSLLHYLCLPAGMRSHKIHMVKTDEESLHFLMSGASPIWVKNSWPGTPRKAEAG